jgi:dihydroflavonol-4-reductase
VYGDLADYDSIKSGMDGCDYAFNCAAIISYNRAYHKDMYRVNVVGTRNVVNAALENSIQRLIHVSSTAAVGICKNNRDLPLEEEFVFDDEFRKIGYMNTKYHSEVEVVNGVNKGLNAIILNPSTIIGEGDRKMNSGAVFRNIKNNRVKIAPPGGSSFISVQDTVKGLKLAMKNGKSGKRYILSTENFRFIEMFNVIASELGSRKIKKELPKWTYKPLIYLSSLIELINKNSPLTPQVIFFSFQYRYFDSSKASKYLDWRPSQNFRSAVREAIAFYKRENLL